MRKVIAFSVIFALAAGAAFAQTANGIFIGASGMGSFAPLVVVSDLIYAGETQKDTGYAVAGAGVSWGAQRPRLEFHVYGVTDHVGFTIISSAEGDFDGDYRNSLLGSQTAGIWVKPFGSDIFKITVGKFADDTLRGKIGSINDFFEAFSLDNVKEEDHIFTRFSTHGVTDANHFSKNHLSGNTFDEVGFMLSSAPIKGLFIGFLADGSMFNENWGGSRSGARAADVYRYMQFGAGYQIGSANIRAQYIGGFMGAYDQKMIADMQKKAFGGDAAAASLDRSIMLEKPARFEFAVAFTGVPNLFLDLGLKAGMPVEFTDTKMKYSNGFNASLGAKYRASAFSITSRVDAGQLGAYTGGRSTGGSGKKTADSPVIEIRLCPVYDLFAVIVGLDLGIIATGESKAANGNGNKDAKTEFGFGAFVKKNFSGGYIKAGLTYTLAEIRDDGKAYGNNIFQIPVVLKYSFF